MQGLCHSVLSSRSVQMPPGGKLARLRSEASRIPNNDAPAKTQGKKHKWHTVDIPDAPCMVYVPTSGEKCPHSRGNVGKYSNSIPWKGNTNHSHVSRHVAKSQPSRLFVTAMGIVSVSARILLINLGAIKTYKCIMPKSNSELLRVAW